MLHDNFSCTTTRTQIRLYKENDFQKWQELFSKMGIKQNQWDWQKENINSLTYERFQKKLQRHANERKENSCMYFCIEERTTRKLIGITILNNIREHEAELGFQLNNSYWKKGLGTEVAEGTVDIAFMVLKLSRVFAVVNPRNAPSIKILEKLHFKRSISNQKGQIEFIKEKPGT